MGFFDTIEKLQTIKPDLRLQGPISDPSSQEASPVPLPTLSRQRKKPAGKSEKLSFLRPCPLCEGRDFVLGSNGGFFCTVCLPETSGQPVEATGPDREKTDLNMSFQAAGMIDAMPRRSDKHQITAQERENFNKAWPWIKERMPELLAGGWSRAALLRRGKFRHPSGNWGVAWLSVWKQPFLHVTIDNQGSIIFHFLSNERTIRQTSRPPVL